MIIAGSACHSRSAHATMIRPRVRGVRRTYLITVFVASTAIAVAVCSWATVHSPRCHRAPTALCRGDDVGEHGDGLSTGGQHLVDDRGRRCVVTRGDRILVA